MSDEGEILQASVKITGDNAGAISAIDQVVSEAQKAVPKASSAIDKIKEKLEDLKKQTGRSSGVGEIGELFEGKGAVLGIALIGKELAEASQKALELSDQFRRGQTDAAGLARGIAESIPVLGSFVSFFDNIGELITGNKAKIEEANRSIELQNELYKIQLGLLHDIERSNQETQRATTRANDQIKITNAKYGVDRLDAQFDAKQNSNQDAHDDRIQDFKDKLKAEEDAEKEAYLKSNGKDANGSQINLTSDQEAALKHSADVNKKRLKDYTDTQDHLLNVQNDAARQELFKEESTADDIIKIHQETRQKLADTAEEQAEAYKQTLIEDGKQISEAEKAKQAKLVQLQADATVASRQKLEELKQQYLDNSAVTAADRVKAYAASLQTLADKGKIAKDSIGGLVAQFAQNQLGGAQADASKNLNDAKFDAAEVGKNAIDKQTDSMKRLADELDKTGVNTSELRKTIDQLNAQEKANATAQKVSDLGFQTSLVGKNPLEAARLQAQHDGLDPNQVGQAQGKLLGAELTESTKGPFQTFSDTMQYYRQLLAQGDISQRTFLAAQNKAFEAVVGSVKHSDIASAARDNISRAFIGLDLTKRLGMPAASQLNKTKEDQTAKAHNTNTDATKSNTNAMTDLGDKIINLTKTIANGVVGVYG